MLSFNTIDNEGIEELAAFLQGNTTISFLDIASIGLSQYPEAAKKVINALQSCSNLISLELSDNGIGN
jgi:Ran GTPase-activating protein (RanGAP) involved in mRNA processing and transport